MRVLHPTLRRAPDRLLRREKSAWATLSKGRPRRTSDNRILKMQTESSEGAARLGTMPRTTFGRLLLLLLLALPVSIHAQYLFAYRIVDGSVTITGYNGLEYDVVVPDTLEGLPVTRIGSQAFFLCSSLTKVAIPDGVTSIGSGAFQGCTGLTNVTIPETVTSIGYAAFWECASLISLTIPASVTSIGTDALYGCDNLSAIEVDPLNPAYSSVDGVLFNKSPDTLMKFPGTKAGSYVIPNRVTNVDNLAFNGCSGLISITVPSSTTNLGNRPFLECARLAAIAVDELNPTYSSVDGVLFNKSLDTLIKYPQDKPGSYIIPNSVTNVGNEAFLFCSGLTSVTIPDGVTNVGISAFSQCTNLTAIEVDPLNPVYRSVDGVLFNKNLDTLTKYPAAKPGNYTIPESVTKIRIQAFNGCTELTSVTIPNSVRNIEDATFGGCFALTNVTLPNSVIGIGNGAFRDCTSLTSITIPSVLIIGNRAFQGCTGLTGITLPRASIGDGAFEGCTA